MIQQTDPTYESLSIPPESLHEARLDIYHSSRPGYHVFREFLTRDQVDHITELWTNLPVSISPPEPTGRGKLPEGCANFGAGGPPLRVWTNFFWNAPMDELTYDVALQVQRLRNRLEARKPYSEILPLTGRAVGFRVVISVQGGAVPAHRDWVGDDYDPARTQATLFLATKGEDYEKGGFFFETNGNETIDFSDVVRAGDLVLWRYGNVHRVDAVESAPGQIGFVRMLFPPEAIARGWKESITFLPGMAQSAVRNRVRRSEFAQSRLMPMYRTLRRPG